MWLVAGLIVVLLETRSLGVQIVGGFQWS
jgi:hypothetical protein